MKNIQNVLTIAKCLYDIMSFLQAYKLQILQTLPTKHCFTGVRSNLWCDGGKKAHEQECSKIYIYIFENQTRLKMKTTQQCIHVDKWYFFYEIPIHSFVLAYQLVALWTYECWCLLLHQMLLRLWCILWCSLQRSLLTSLNSSCRWTWNYNAWGSKKVVINCKNQSSSVS